MLTFLVGCGKAFWTDTSKERRLVMSYILITLIEVLVVGMCAFPVIMGVFTLIDWAFGKKIVERVLVVRVKDHAWIDHAFGDEHVDGTSVFINFLFAESVPYRSVDAKHLSYAAEFVIRNDSPIPDVGDMITVKGRRGRITGDLYLTSVV